MNNIQYFRLGMSCVARHHPMTLGEFSDLSVSYLNKLKAMHPMFHDGLHFMGTSRKTSPAVSHDVSNAESWILKNAWDRKAPLNWFTNLDAKGLATRHTTSNRLAFRFRVSNLQPSDRDGLNISVGGGGCEADSGGAISIRFPIEGAPEFYNFAFCKELLRLTVDHWQPQSGGVTNQALWERTEITQPLAPEVFGVDWLNYHANPQAAADLPPEVEVEPFGPGGIFFALASEPPIDQTRLDAMAPEAQRIRDAWLPGQWLVRKPPRT